MSDECSAQVDAPGIFQPEHVDDDDDDLLVIAMMTPMMLILMMKMDMTMLMIITMLFLIELQNLEFQVAARGAPETPYRNHQKRGCRSNICIAEGKRCEAEQTVSLQGYLQTLHLKDYDGT